MVVVIDAVADHELGPQIGAGSQGPHAIVSTSISPCFACASASSRSRCPTGGSSAAASRTVSGAVTAGAPRRRRAAMAHRVRRTDSSPRPPRPRASRRGRARGRWWMVDVLSRIAFLCELLGERLGGSAHLHAVLELPGLALGAVVPGRGRRAVAGGACGRGPVGVTSRRDAVTNTLCRRRPGPRGHLLPRGIARPRPAPRWPRGRGRATRRRRSGRR